MIVRDYEVENKILRSELDEVISGLEELEKLVLGFADRIKEILDGRR